MSKLEDLQPSAAVRGILLDALVTVVSVQWFGSEALELTYKTPAGKVANELLYRHDEPRLEVVEQGRPWSFDGDGGQFRLVKVGDATWRLGQLRHYAVDDDGDLPGHALPWRRFKPAGGLGLAAKIMLGVDLFLSLLMLGGEFLQYRLAARLMAGADVPDAELIGNDTRQMMLGIVHHLAYLATAIVFVIWFYRAHANLKPLGARHLTYSSGWAAGYWFVPILNLFRPVQIAQEIWRNSDPDAVAVEDVHLGRSGNSALLGFWWAMWIISNVIANISSRMAWDVNSPASLRAASIAGMIAEVANILAAMLALAVVIGIDARQTARAGALRAQAGLPREIEA